MPAIDRYDVLVIGSGEAGKYLAWTLSKAGHRTALIERKMVGGSCPNVACLPSKNIIHSAKVASLAARAAEFGLEVRFDRDEHAELCSAASGRWSRISSRSISAGTKPAAWT